MLSGKTVSVKELIGEIFRDLRYKYELSYSDSIEWSMVAVELIGAPMALSPRISKIKIENHRGKLPCNLSSITQVGGSYSGCGIFPMTTATNSFHPVLTCDVGVFDSLAKDADWALQNQTIQGLQGDPILDLSGNPVLNESGVPMYYTLKDPLYYASGYQQVPDGESNQVTGNNATYNVSDNYIFTNFKDGCVFMAYNALPVDDEGFPMIPDNRRFKEAVKAYIVSKIDYILYRSGELSKDLFERSEREWLFYVASAGNIAKMPNVDGMQAIVNQMRLIPNRYAHSSFFKNI